MHRLLKIDELLRPQHYYLASDDDCYYFMDYTSGAGFGHSPANDLILNFKKSMETRGERQWQYKAAAIRIIGDILNQSLGPLADFSGSIFVPIPPSKRIDHEEYDDRVVQVLKLYCQGRENVKVLELLTTEENTEAAHESVDRPGPGAIAGNLTFHADLCERDCKKIVLVDDVITTGAHFVGCRNVLQAQLPKAKIVGLFIARRAFF